LAAETERSIIGPKDQKRLKKCLASLFFWGNDYDVGNGALDERLRRCPSLRYMVLSVLMAIAIKVKDGNEP
jgi:hypothetical protein